MLVLTTYADDESLFPALQAGARGYLTKDASAEEIEQAIRAVAAGPHPPRPGRPAAARRRGARRDAAAAAGPASCPTTSPRARPRC